MCTGVTSKCWGREPIALALMVVSQLQGRHPMVSTGIHTDVLKVNTSYLLDGVDFPKKTTKLNS
ncbi:MAG: hypothetical protein B6D77_12615 [gamma proteobacterium symbiont of Ctena orbiculata]|nr:MAG: hypothetical protein B6D77_12615 [gamma proteobacterium symbiont of Ctena orbiculata]